MVKTSQRFVSQAIINRVTFGNLNQKKYITVHQTGNTSHGANAEMHARLQENGNSRQASWHWQVDDKEAIQSFPHGVSCWHCGDGRGDGNMHSIGVEICINSDGDYKKAVENGARLVRQIMEQEGIPIGNVKQHWDWSRKNCPQQIRAGQQGINWTDFINLVNRKVEVVMSNDLYRVQVGAFANKENAERLADELKAKGYPVYIPSSGEVNAPSTPKPTPKPQPLKSGDRVRLNNSASKYATGENIPSNRKNKAYTVHQTRTGQVLLREIMSWVHERDVTRL